MLRSATVGIALGIVMVAGSPAHAGVDPVAACREKKAKATGKKAGNLLKAFGKNVKKPNATRLGNDVSKARSKFTKAFTKAESGTCQTTGDVGEIEGKVDAFVVDAVASVSSAPAFGPQGSEFEVNTYTTNNQWFPAVGVDGAGNFIVVWDGFGSTGADSGASVQGQRYDSAGTPRGSEFQINTYTTDLQRGAAVGVDGAGNFVVVWESRYQDGDGYGVFGQRYDSAGTPQGGEFQVNTYTTSIQQSAAVGMDAAGNFVVAWYSIGNAESDSSGSVQGQRYDSTGTPQGSEFQVNTYTTFLQGVPAVGVDGAGNFVVVWDSGGSAGSDTSSWSIQGQRYDSAGTPQGSEFQVNTYTTNAQQSAAVDVDGAGNFVVVWTSGGSAGSDSSDYSIQGQRYDSAGTPEGSEFQVNTYTTGFQFSQAVGVDGAGNFVVVWTSGGSTGSDSSPFSVQGQRYDSTGTPQGSEFQVNTYTTGPQNHPAVGVEGAGNFVVVWDSYGSTGSDSSALSVQGQRFSGL